MSGVHKAWRAAASAAADAAGLASRGKPLTAAFSDPEEQPEAAFTRTVRLALVALAVLVLGNSVNSLLGCVFAFARQRVVTRDSVRDLAAQAQAAKAAREAEAKALRADPPAVRMRRQAEARDAAQSAQRRSALPKPSTWADAQVLLGAWERDDGASDDPEPMHELLQLTWAQRQALSLASQLVVDEDDEDWQLATHGLMGAVGSSEWYPKSGAGVELPRRDGREGGATCAARPVDGGVQLTQALGSDGQLREWLGVTTVRSAAAGGEPQDVLVRHLRLQLHGSGAWEGIQVYRRPGEPPLPHRDAAADDGGAGGAHLRQPGLRQAEDADGGSSSDSEAEAEDEQGALAPEGALEEAAGGNDEQEYEDEEIRAWRRRRQRAGDASAPLHDELAGWDDARAQEMLMRTAPPALLAVLAAEEAAAAAAERAARAEAMADAIKYGDDEAAEQQQVPSAVAALGDAIVDMMPSMFAGAAARKRAEEARLASLEAAQRMAEAAERARDALFGEGSASAAVAIVEGAVASASAVVRGAGVAATRAQLQEWLEQRRRTREDGQAAAAAPQ